MIEPLQTPSASQHGCRETETFMQIQVNTDRNIEGNEALTEWAQGLVAGPLEYLGDHVTRIEMHLSDSNSDKKGGAANMRCLLEARLAGLAPIAASHEAETLEQAIHGAVSALKQAIDTVRGRLATT